MNTKNTNKEQPNMHNDDIATKVVIAHLIIFTVAVLAITKWGFKDVAQNAQATYELNTLGVALMSIAGASAFMAITVMLANVFCEFSKSHINRNNND